MKVRLLQYMCIFTILSLLLGDAESCECHDPDADWEITGEWAVLDVGRYYVGCDHDLTFDGSRSEDTYDCPDCGECEYNPCEPDPEMIDGIKKYEWLFGDGASMTETCSSPDGGEPGGFFEGRCQHKYDGPYRYTARLTVHDDDKDCCGDPGDHSGSQSKTVVAVKVRLGAGPNWLAQDYVQVNNDDDNVNGKCDNDVTETPVSGEDDLVKVNYEVRPAAYVGGGKLQLMRGGTCRIRVWDSATKNNLLIPDGENDFKAWDIASFPAELWVEGTANSPGLMDTELTLTYGRDVSGTLMPVHSDTVKFTVVLVDLAVGAVLEKDEIKTGLFIGRNDDDDNDNDANDLEDTYVYNENDLVDATMWFVYPLALTGTVVLNGPDKVKLWSDWTKATELGFPESHSIRDDGMPYTHWLEGYKPSAAARDVELVLSFDVGGKTFKDVVKTTIVDVECLKSSKAETGYLWVAKWQDAFDPGPSVKPNFIDNDPNRFYIRVTDFGKKGEGKVSITLLTKSPGTDYDDDSTEIELTETGTNTGIYESKSMMMMSDDVDDDYAVDAIADDVKNDRSHIVALGGKVQINYWGSPADPVGDIVLVPKPEDIKTVNVHVVVLKNGDTVLMGEAFVDADNDGVRDVGENYRDTDGSGTYTANLSPADAFKRVEEEIFEVATERYAQVNVEFALSMTFRQAPAAINDGVIEVSQTSPSGDSNLSADEKSLLQAGFNSAPNTDIEVYYVTKIKWKTSHQRGWAFPADWYRNMTTTDLNDSFMISNKGGYYSAGHEAYHIFSQMTSHSVDPVNLFCGTTGIVRKSEASVTDSKRLTESQETVIRNSEYAQ